MRYLLDTNVFRQIGHPAPHRAVAAWLAQLNDANLAISVLTVREVTKGIVRLRSRKPDAADAIAERAAQVFERFADRTLPIGSDIAALWGELLAESERHIDDTGLAATARVHGLVLVTRNVAHVAGRGCRVLDPFASRPVVREI